jgi:hypothetical protein
MNRELINVIEQIGREKGINSEILFEALESALLSASKKTQGAPDNIRMHLDRKTGVLRVYGRKKVVAEVTDPKLEITLGEAKALNPDAELDDELERELSSLAVPVRGPRGPALGFIGVSGPSGRLDARRRRTLVEPLRAAADRLARAAAQHR